MTNVLTGAHYSANAPVGYGVFLRIFRSWGGIAPCFASGMGLYGTV